MTSPFIILGLLMVFNLCWYKETDNHLRQAHVDAESNAPLGVKSQEHLYTAWIKSASFHVWPILPLRK